MTSLTLIVAATLTNGIGQSARLPWRLPQEMSYFARVTTAAPEGSVNAVIMGRNTWESIPTKFRPLKDRVNVVISSNDEYLKGIQDISEEQFRSTNARVLGSTGLQEAIHRVSASAETPNIHRCFIIGGASIYKAALELTSSRQTNTEANANVDRILLTRILSPAFEDCNVFFPEFRETFGLDYKPLWSQASHEELEGWVGGAVPKGTQYERGVEYEFQMWMRKA